MSSEQVQQLLNHAQVYQQQMQGIMTQKEAFSMQLNEIEKTLEEIAKTKETEMYKVSGAVLIKSTKSEIKKELTEKKEIMGLRVKTLEKNEKKIKAKIEEIRDKLSRSAGAGDN